MRYVGLGFVVIGAACAGTLHMTPTEGIINTFGCNADSVRHEWATARGGEVNIGDPLCRAIGRWGTPEMTGSSQFPGSAAVYLRWPGSPTISLSARAYSDTAMARRAGVPVGQWVVNNIIRQY